MIDRYTRPRMKALWSEENKWAKTLEIEILACEAQAELGDIPAEAVKVIKEKAAFDLKRIEEIERETRHDVIAFLTNVAENIGPESRYIHLGLTSSDVGDTCLFLRTKEAGELILKDLKKLMNVLAGLAGQYKDTVMIGRTHGVHAEPLTFGLKIALWWDECRRDLIRLEEAIKTISVGKLSGAVGTFVHLAPYVEKYVCEKLGLTPAPVSTQILQRDRLAHFMTTLAILGGSLEKFATEIRNLQRTEIREVEEGFRAGQKGSSAMPHKRNPITAERVSGLSRVLRGNCLAALEDMALWHERDISHSSVERVIIPDSTILIDYMLDKFTTIMENLLVYPDRMKQNLEATRGLLFSQRVLLELAKKGLSREDAYRLVQRNAMRVWAGEKDFQSLLLEDKDISSWMTQEEISACFDLGYYMRNIELILNRVGIPA
ncbi:MAG: adenylosuccinate lyase [bacterium]|nr:adenylosuccinate lyase [bacterium]